MTGQNHEVSSESSLVELVGAAGFEPAIARV
jgi:hypothetical protein